MVPPPFWIMRLPTAWAQYQRPWTFTSKTSCHSSSGTSAAGFYLDYGSFEEVFIGAAIERTRYIRLGSGVTSLPYHHPLMVANRFVQLDHMSRGRTMLGCGPGALPSDAYMMGIDPSTQRDRMEQSLSAIMQLL
jgi:alkanesulfonate monooxygenase SsuD/methylene tetrahydromethanopterin reductase-like flavin-dependent oxidoreductase (luciferase family)